jgi:molybdenum cofactor biosynthesis enzyme MoaA
MELIIKPTEKCNFKCTFCSSTHLTELIPSSSTAVIL